MKNRIKALLLTLLRILPLVICIVCMGLYLFSGRDLSAENLLDFAPEDPLFAALFLLLLYAVKSLTVVFPIIVLNILGGFLFDPVPAIIINSVGVIIELIIPYLVGKYSGSGFVQKLVDRHPILSDLMELQQKNEAFMTFFLRIISLLPGDAVSMYLGSTGTPLRKYLIASFLGSFPGLVATTLIGASITDPTSPLFWFSIGLTAALSAASVTVYIIRKRAMNKRSTK